MKNPVEYIQKTILGTASANVIAKLNEHHEQVVRDVYDFHNWTWLVKSEELTLETNTITYDLPGESRDLAKIVDIYYGAAMTPLSDEYPNRKAFYKLKYGQPGIGTTPTHWVPDKKPNGYSQTVIIYPCSDTSLETVTYDYKKLFHIRDVGLYPNPMVFVDGIMSRYLTGVAVNTADPNLAARLAQLARDYLAAYKAGKNQMRENDSPVTVPKMRIEISDASKRQLATIKMLKGVGKRR